MKKSRRCEKCGVECHVDIKVACTQCSSTIADERSDAATPFNIQGCIDEGQASANLLLYCNAVEKLLQAAGYASGCGLGVCLSVTSPKHVQFWASRSWNAELKEAMLELTNKQAGLEKESRTVDMFVKMESQQPMDHISEGTTQGDPTSMSISHLHSTAPDHHLAESHCVPTGDPTLTIDMSFKPEPQYRVDSNVTGDRGDNIHTNPGEIERCETVTDSEIPHPLNTISLSRPSAVVFPKPTTPKTKLKRLTREYGAAHSHRMTKSSLIQKLKVPGPVGKWQKRASSSNATSRSSVQLGNYSSRLRNALEMCGLWSADTYMKDLGDDKFTIIRTLMGSFQVSDIQLRSDIAKKLQDKRSKSRSVHVQSDQAKSSPIPTEEPYVVSKSPVPAPSKSGYPLTTPLDITEDIIDWGNMNG